MLLVPADVLEAVLDAVVDADVVRAAAVVLAVVEAAARLGAGLDAPAATDRAPAAGTSVDPEVREVPATACAVCAAPVGAGPPVPAAWSLAGAAPPDGDATEGDATEPWLRDVP